jgi:DNA-binding transcriptional LysR family regulator
MLLPRATEAAPSEMLDWDDLRFFLAVARKGSLSSAAQELRCTQSTVGRRLAFLQSGLGVRLLNRTPRGYVLTPAGESVVEHAKRVEAEALAVERAVAGGDARLEGSVTVACIESVANIILAPCFTALHRDYPEVVIELVPATRHLSLPGRDADISIHQVRPEQHEVFVRRIGSIAFGLYANHDYLERYGTPDYASCCLGHRVIALPDELGHLPQVRWLADLTTKARIVVKTNSYETRLYSALAGDGLACLPRFHADEVPGLRRLDDPPIPAPVADLWLAVHQDNRKVRRIRAVIQSITKAVSKHVTQ